MQSDPELQRLLDEEERATKRFTEEASIDTTAIPEQGYHRMTTVVIRDTLTEAEFADAYSTTNMRKAALEDEEALRADPSLIADAMHDNGFEVSVTINR